MRIKFTHINSSDIVSLLMMRLYLGINFCSHVRHGRMLFIIVNLLSPFKQRKGRQRAFYTCYFLITFRATVLHSPERHILDSSNSTFGKF